MFDGYDVGVRYADQAVSDLCTALEKLGVLEETAIWIGSDHGEAFGELGVYADHMAADEATSHIPTILRWPGIEKSSQAALLYHLDVATTVADLAGAHLPTHWDGQSFRPALEAGTAVKGRDQLVISQGAWTCQRGVRFGDWLYLRTFHDGYHAAWNVEMLFDVATDPHEQENRVDDEPMLVEEARSILESWTDEQLARSLGTTDPMDVILGEGGPFHVRDHLPSYLSRLEETDRGHWAEVLRQRYPDGAIARPSVATQLRDIQVGRSS
jgi:arylsulfatase A-like enzyme